MILFRTRLLILSACLMLSAHVAHPDPNQSLKTAELQAVSEDNVSNLLSFSGMLGVIVNRQEAQDALSSVKNEITPIEAILRGSKELHLPVESQSLTFDQLMSRGGVAVIGLKDSGQTSVLMAVSPQFAIGYEQGITRIYDSHVLAQRYNGKAIVVERQPNARVLPVMKEPVRMIDVSSVGNIVTEEMIIENQGDHTLNLQIESTSCGCSAAELSLQSLEPGQKAKLKMVIHPNSWGAKAIFATIRTDDPLWPRIVCGFYINMPKTAIPRPESMEIQVEQGQTISRYMTLLLPESGSISNIESRQRFITSKSVGREPVEGGVLERIQITISDQAPVGTFTDELTFKLKDAGVAQIGVPINGLVKSDLTATQFFLGTISNGLVINKTAIVKSLSGRPFSIQSSKTTNKQIVIKPLSDVEATAHAIEIQVTPLGKLNTAISDTVELTLSDSRVIRIPVSGMIVEKQTISSESNFTDEAAPLKVGKSAPPFSVMDADGETWSSSKLLGKKCLLLTFFPKCFTGGCTAQLTSIQENLAQLKTENIQILAVSVDNAPEQVAFATKFGFDFPLIPDTERKLSQIYGATQSPEDLASRLTVLIDKEGIVRWIDSDIHVQTHGADILKKIKELGIGESY